MIFGIFDLLGLRFAPRIRDLDRQRLYRYGTSPSTDIDELLKHKLRPELITPYWDELLRLAASLRHGWAPASLLLTRLQAGSRRNPLARALQEYGRLIKTNFVLAWLVDEELRRRVGRQLNKGEQLHALRRSCSMPTKVTSAIAPPSSRLSKRFASPSWSTRSSSGTPSTPSGSWTSSAPTGS